MTVKFCKDCKHSQPERDSSWRLRCMNPLINKNDAWALSATTFTGSDCHTERERGWFAKCGMKGKLYEARDSD